MRIVVVLVVVLVACSAGAADMVDVPRGEWVMGDDAGRRDERPAGAVFLDAFAVDRYEVTNQQYARFVTASGEPAPVYWIDGAAPKGSGNHPVVGVSWRQAAAYCAWVGKRLPTEAEWERACRGPDGRSYPWGDGWDPGYANVAPVPLDDPDNAWTWLTAGGPAALVPVADHGRDVTAEGVCHLAGNAAEWVADWYDPAAYTRLGDTNPIGDGPEWNHVVRGGAWLFRFGDEVLMAQHSRCAFRGASHSADDPRVGFRCAADAG